ncbi:MAG: LysR family transcriptional regulator [Rhodospirillales bacterium]|jgi:DNA-binding transcriptional LysR family regulator|nr:LysR family transcriptional regulator [Rhodospirillales bacterium]
MDNLADMAVFVKVVEAHGFSAAARRLRLSKSAVSKRVSRLEERLGARLLNRTTRRLSLTEEGSAFHQRAKSILADIEEAEQAVSRLHAVPRGTLRVSAPMSFGTLHLAPAVPDFMARYPDLRVDIALNDRLVDLVDEGFDLAIRIARLPDSTLIARRLAPRRVVVCAAPGYWRRAGVPARPEDLKDHNCLHYSYLLSDDAWPFTGPDGAISVKVSGTFMANNGEALSAAAIAGTGVALLPTFIAGPDLRAGRLRAVLGDYEETGPSIYAVYPHARHLSAKVRAFVDFLAARFGPEPYWDAP